MTRRVERHPDSCRRSSAIKDKYGYVSHVYSAAPGRTRLLVSAVGGALVELCTSTTGAMTAEVADRTPGCSTEERYPLQESNLSHKNMKNGSNSKKNAPKTNVGLDFLFAVGAHHLSNINKVIARSANGSADWLCLQQDHSSTRRALLQHYRDSCDFPPFLHRHCFSLLMNFSSAT